MELGQLKYFILTAQLQNMSKAAQTLGIAQPTLSRSITSLEKELGTQLFDRSGKTLILNERGKRFLESARASIEDLENAVAAARARVADYTINVGLFCMSERLISCLGKFSKEWPDTLFDISQPSGNPDHIDTNEYDVLLYPREALFRRYRGQHIFSEKYFLAVNNSDMFSEKAQIHMDELRDKKLIFVKYGAKTYDNAYLLYKSIVRENIGCNFCSSLELQRLMILAGQGFGFVPDESAGSYIADARISLIPIADKSFARDIFIGFKRENHLSERSRQLMQFILEYFSIDA